MNVLLKGASMLAIGPEQRHGRQAAWHNLSGKIETTGLIPQLSCSAFSRSVLSARDATGGLKLLGTCANHTSQKALRRDQHSVFL